eukprot:5753431-Pyramimonas_sp.AAC.1
MELISFPASYCSSLSWPVCPFRAIGMGWVPCAFPHPSGTAVYTPLDPSTSPDLLAWPAVGTIVRVAFGLEFIDSEDSAINDEKAPRLILAVLPSRLVGSG